MSTAVSPSPSPSPSPVPVPVTFQEIVDFIKQHRRKKAFPNWTDNQILASILEALNDKGCCVTSNPTTGKISGIILAGVNHREKLVYVRHLLTDGGKGAVSSMIRRCKEWYPNYKISGRRHEHIKDFSPAVIEKFQQKV